MRITQSGLALDLTSDAIDEVNVLKTNLWDAESHFDDGKDKTQFRDYEAACERVKNFYKEQHEKQTVAFNIKARAEFKTRTRAHMGIWEAMEMLNTLVDESDPDTDLSQIEHLLQTAEAIRRDGKPEWMQVAGLVHDLGKLLHFFGSEGQWDVVGYLYHVLKDQSTLPFEALAMIRYHSFYPWHRDGAYMHLTNEKDKESLAAVRAFNPYDLYSKSDAPCDVAALRPYYEGLIAKFFPPVLNW
ncbi:hypothetical protein H0H81_011683 [Sphagnurus paluster]|uniref:Inositol oxygenase n=1 Tax=Sphagnurus paluster TaxID=117069 RepID=A0A9P7FU22_9AGAR|nr:hypothetical protein H0H81_011683 [Sphagnurus paluster]